MANSDAKAVVLHGPATRYILKTCHEGDLLTGIPGVGEFGLAIKNDTATAKNRLRIELDILKNDIYPE